MAKLVCHGKKYAKGAISKIERHNERQNEHYSNHDIDLQRSHLNYQKEKVELATVIQGQKQELQVIAEKQADIRSLDEITTGKTLLGGKVTVEEDDYQKLADWAKKQIAVESKEKKLKKENATLRKANQELMASNEALNAQLTSEQSMSQRLTFKKLEAEVRELRKFKQIAEKFLTEHGLKDYFRKAFIHSNNQEL